MVSIGPVALSATTCTSLRALSAICASVQRPMRPKPLMPMVMVMRLSEGMLRDTLPLPRMPQRRKFKNDHISTC